MRQRTNPLLLMSGYYGQHAAPDTPFVETLRSVYRAASLVPEGPLIIARHFSATRR